MTNQPTRTLADFPVGSRWRRPNGIVCVVTAHADVTHPLLVKDEQPGGYWGLATASTWTRIDEPAPDGLREAEILGEVLELARRDLMRTQTDFIGRMAQALSDFECVCDDHPDGDWPLDAMQEADEALCALAGLALAQIATVRRPSDPMAALAQPAPASEPVAFNERRDRFAAAALTGLLARGLDDARALERAFWIADAILQREAGE